MAEDSNPARALTSMEVGEGEWRDRDHILSGETDSSLLPQQTIEQKRSPPRSVCGRRRAEARSGVFSPSRPTPETIDSPRTWLGFSSVEERATSSTAYPTL
ncbi:hypothetical protein QL285_097525 [Trifolium repens]|nr:hypothetical protein QL285_098266 [Trifolium repens]KAK2351128.1 hypothetical protein QL285_097525 [Trifolium repens]